AALLCYVALWTLYGTLAKASQDIHVDMSEQFALARKLALGYPKHPPLTMAVVRAWFAVFPAADWAYYLLAMANVGLTLWIVWRLMARFVDGEKRVVGLAMLTLVPFFNFHALKFNVNTVLMPLWAVTTLWFLRSFENRRPLDAALVGLAAAASMYGKYWSVFLLIGLGLAALADPRRPSPVRRAVGDGGGRCAGAGAACSLACRQRFRAVLVCRDRAWRELARFDPGGGRRLSHRQRRLCRDPPHHRRLRRASRRCHRQGHGLADATPTSAGSAGILGRAAGAGA